MEVIDVVEVRHPRLFRSEAGPRGVVERQGGDHLLHVIGQEHRGGCPRAGDVLPREGGEQFEGGDDPTPTMTIVSAASINVNPRGAKRLRQLGKMGTL